MSRPRFAVSREDYLKALWELAGEGQPVISAQLCRELGVSSAAVSKALHRLVRDRLASQSANGGIALTAEGQRLAERLVRRHRLIERLLYDALQFPWDEVHEEAERLEHAISDRLEAALLARYGDKATCPHGYPVTPRATRRGRLLADFAEAQEGSIVRVYEKEPALLKLFATLKLLPGSRVRLVRRLPDDTFEILVNQRKVQIGLKAARGLWLLPEAENTK
jgi:DtxR family Mn-dependent transcriptional regulator